MYVHVHVHVHVCFNIFSPLHPAVRLHRTVHAQRHHPDSWVFCDGSGFFCNGSSSDSVRRIRAGTSTCWNMRLGQQYVSGVCEPAYSISNLPFNPQIQRMMRHLATVVSRITGSWSWRSVCMALEERQFTPSQSRTWMTKYARRIRQSTSVHQHQTKFYVHERVKH